MKLKANRTSKNIAVSIIIMLILLCSFNFTYSYFTAVANINGAGSFGDLQVNYGYMATSGSSSVSYTENNTLQIALDDSAGIMRGNTYNVKQANGDALYQLGFVSTSGSCDALVKLHLSVKIVQENGTGNWVEVDNTDYGQYFTLTNVAFTQNSNKTDYYYNNVVIPGYNGFGAGQTKIKIEETLPVDVLNNNIQITITFTAVQAANRAYIAVFGEGVYPSTWTTYGR